MNNTFSAFYNPEKTLEQTEDNNTQKRLIERMQGDNLKLKKARKNRIFKQIDCAIKQKKKVYYYLTKDKLIIDQYLIENEDKCVNIKFIRDLID